MLSLGASSRTLALARSAPMRFTSDAVNKPRGKIRAQKGSHCHRARHRGIAGELNAPFQQFVAT